MAARQVSRSRRGFTVVELLATVAIAAVLIAIVASSSTTVKPRGRLLT